MLIIYLEQKYINALKVILHVEKKFIVSLYHSKHIFFIIYCEKNNNKLVSACVLRMSFDFSQLVGHSSASCLMSEKYTV